MAVGERIRRIRYFRGMTQKELGVAIGFDEKSADVRIAQYENETRKPKEPLLRKIAEVLDVNYLALYEPDSYSTTDVLFLLFEFDEIYNVQLYDVIDNSDPCYPEKHIAVSFEFSLMDSFLEEWRLRKKQLANGEITNEEYTEWKLNWPQTADDCGKFKPQKEWRKKK